MRRGIATTTGIAITANCFKPHPPIYSIRRTHIPMHTVIDILGSSMTRAHIARVARSIPIISRKRALLLSERLEAMNIISANFASSDG